MLRAPRAVGEPLLNRFLLWRILFVSALMVVGSLGFFLWEESRGDSIELARTVAVNALVMGEVFYLFNCRYLTASSGNLSSFIGSRPALVTIAAVIALQVLFTYTAPFQHMFGTAAIDAGTWGRILLFGILLFIAVEAEKALIRYRARR